MRAILIQPPFAQLNAPYPAVHYLEAFLRGRGIAASSHDHSIELYRAIFSRPGLARIFADARAALAPRLASGDLDDVTRNQVERYLSYESLYLEWIEELVALLAESDPGIAHRVAAAAELPRGRRAEALLEAAGGRVGPEGALGLATAVLEDLADFIAYALDSAFGTVRYADRLASSLDSFAEIRDSLASSYILRSFYAPWLEGFWIPSAKGPAAGGPRAAEEGEPILVLISIPFPGCLAGALECAASARRVLGDRAIVVAGGGYVSTELRNLSDPAVFDFFDALSFDAGYGSLAAILDALAGTGPEARSAAETLRNAGGLYRTMTRGTDCRVSRLVMESTRYATEERRALESVFPDYRSADFARYLRAVDSANPMHRLWSDAPWLKYALARSCYWRRCAFCDTELEYVAGYVPARVEALAAAASEAAERSGIHGIHFVDEAMPMASLLAFALANRGRAAAGLRPFRYWGNVRFDASWTEGRCELLAASGLVAVSGGIEIATERGLEMTGKGFGLAELVRSLVAMRRAGLLVHAYLIYGFPGQSGADIADSAEVVRQLFAADLVDSAFWHRFVLTRHSRMYAEWKAGGRPGLKPIDRPRSFADNDLGFEGEEAFDRYDAPLSAALAAWMEGESLDRPAASLPGLGKKAARVDHGLVESLIASAEAALDKTRVSPLPERGRLHWVAGAPMESRTGGLVWARRGNLERLTCDAASAGRVAAAIALASRPEGASAADFLEAIGPARSFISALRDAGLAIA